MLLKPSLPRRRQRGFTIVELLVTILIVTVGLMGIVKMQAAAVSNTAVSRTRALMTYQAESLAGMMRANRGFWKTSGTPLNGSWPAMLMDGTSATPGTTTGMTNVAAGGCASTCLPDKIAYDDIVNVWAPAYYAAFPGATARIDCVPASGTGSCTNSPTAPHSYDITLTWKQKIVAVNRSTAGTTAEMTSPVSMIMHVQP